MKNIPQIVLVCMCLSATTFVNAQQQPQPQHKEQSKNVEKKNSREKDNNQYSTEVYYFTKNKLSEDALRKKILKLSGVKDARINLGNSSITVQFDGKKNSKEKMKKSFNKWGTLGDFQDRQSGRNENKNSHNAKDKPVEHKDSKEDKH